MAGGNQYDMKFVELVSADHTTTIIIKKYMYEKEKDIPPDQ